MTTELRSILLLTAAFLVFLVIAGRKLGFLSLSSLFLYSQFIMAIGIIPSLDDYDVADTTHRDLILFTFLSYVLGALLVVGTLGRDFGRETYSPDVNFEYPRKVVNFWILLSIAIGVAYYVAIGYVAFFESLSTVAEGGSEDVAGLRLESYAGSRYLFPGYVNQFKNALLPALVLVVVVASYKLKNPSRLLTAVGLGSITLVLLIGTGQRHPLIKVLVLAVIFAYLFFPKLAVRSVVSAVAVGAPLFFLTTFASGRITTELESADSLSGRASVLVDQMIFRFFAGSQSSATIAFRYVHSRDEVVFGSEWLRALLGLLPGQPGSDIANQVFELMYGSSRGTSPLSLWGSAYHNFGFGGTLLFAGLLGVLFARISASFLKRKTLNLIQAVGMAGITMTLGLWTTEGPTTILNSGLVVFLLLLYWGDRIEKRKSVLSQRRKHLTRDPNIPTETSYSRNNVEGVRR
jgi:oligosaccharide repeat unit polymerase